MSTPNRRDPNSSVLRVIDRAYRALSRALQHDSRGIRMLGGITWLLLLGVPSATVIVLITTFPPPYVATILGASTIVTSVSHRLAARARAARARAVETAGKRAALPRIARGAARLLPASVRDEYQEEWAAWIIDLRTTGTPRRRRWAHLLTIMLIAAPWLAIALRLAARRAVDR